MLGNGASPVGAILTAPRISTLLAAAGAVAALAAAAAPARAADACPNAEIRAEQHATRLPDCRAYELVSPVQKFGNGIGSDGFVSSTGDAVEFRANGAFSGALSNVLVEYVARRSADGWTTTPFAPPMNGARLPRLQDTPMIQGMSADFRRAVVQTGFPIDPLDQGGNVRVPLLSDDLFLLDGHGAVDWISPSATLPDTSTNPVSMVAASPDLHRILMASKRILTPGVPDQSILRYYLRTEGQPTTLVSAAPDGTPLPTAVSEIRMSADGSRIVFTDGPYGAHKLYMRTNGADATQTATVVPTFGPDHRACENAQIDALSADGSKLLFRCSTALTDVSHTTMQGYLADLDTGTVQYIGYTGEVVAATDDLSRGFIFQWPTVLVLHDGTVTATTPSSSRTLDYVNASISPNGRYLAFESRGTDVDFGFPTGNLRQVYRVSAASGQVECVSCPTDGSVAQGEASLRWGFNPPAPGWVTNDGRVFFNAQAPLVSRDVNGKEDVYEWIDGRDRLISSGTSDADSSLVRGADDGRSVFFLTADSLVAQDIDEGVRDLYVARVDGGFAAPVKPAECTSGCQGPPADGPAPPRLGSLAFSGSGNVAFVPRAERARLAVARPRVARRRSVRLRVRVSSAGRIAVSGPRVRRVRRSVRRAGTSRVVVRLKRRAVRRLRARGAIRARVRVTFRPASGRAVSKVVRVRFKHSKRARMHKHAKRASRRARHAASVARLHAEIRKGGR